MDWFEELLSKPFPRKVIPEEVIKALWDDDPNLVKPILEHWYKAFGKYYQQLQRSNAVSLDSYLLEGETPARYADIGLDLLSLYAFNDYHLCEVQGVAIDNVFEGWVQFFKEESYWHTVLALTYRMYLDKGGLKTVDILRYKAANSSLVQVRRACNSRICQAVDDSVALGHMSAEQWDDVIKENKILSVLHPDILCDNLEMIHKHTWTYISRGALKAKAMDVAEKKKKIDEEPHKPIADLLNCEDEKKQGVINLMGQYLQEYHDGMGVSCLVVAMKECKVSHSSNALKDGSPLLRFHDFASLVKPLHDSFPTVNIIKYNAAKDSFNKVWPEWTRVKKGIENYVKGDGETADKTMRFQNMNIDRIRDLITKFQSVI